MVSLYNILTDTEPPRARPGPSRPSSSSGGPPAAARCGGVTNPTTEHRDAVGRSEAQLGVCIAHPGLSPGPINRRLRRRAQELVFTRSKCVRKRVNKEINRAVISRERWATHTNTEGQCAPRPARRACITQVDCMTPRVSGTQRCASRYSPTIPTCLTGSSGSSGRGRGQRVRPG